MIIESSPGVTESIAGDDGRKPDPASQTWQVVSAWARAEEKKALEALVTADNYNSGEKLRGRIIALRDLLALVKPDVVASNLVAKVPPGGRGRDISGY